jgi:hypothetical protein
MDRGEKQWVKQQVQKYQDYVRVEEMPETQVWVLTLKNGTEYYAQDATGLTLKIRKTTVRDVVL